MGYFDLLDPTSLSAKLIERPKEEQPKHPGVPLPGPASPDRRYSSTTNSEKKEEKNLEKRTGVIDEQTYRDLYSRMEAEPIIQAQTKWYLDLKNRLNKVNSQKAPIDISAFSPLMDFATRGRYGLSQYAQGSNPRAEHLAMKDKLTSALGKAGVDLAKMRTDFMKSQLLNTIQTGVTTGEGKTTIEGVGKPSGGGKDADGKTLSASTIKDLAEAQKSFATIDDLQKQLNALKDIDPMKPLESYAQYDTFSKAREMAAQEIGKALQGRMTDKDLEIIKNMIPDVKNLMLKNADEIFENMKRKIITSIEAYKNTLRESGYKVPEGGKTDDDKMRSEIFGK